MSEIAYTEYDMAMQKALLEAQEENDKLRDVIMAMAKSLVTAMEEIDSTAKPPEVIA